ncbi:MAG: TIR domain-containing protein, partial [Anaerolineales bacterium]|nr:TIR domain-containing protein [Anaerolineales bacterium]
MAYDVFISYSSKDKAVADAVCATLERRKIRCWIAPRDIPPGKPYAASLVNAISESRVFVLVLSEGSNQSSHVLREVGEAVDNGIPILPLRIEDVEPSQEMRYYIKSIHWLDAMTPPMEQHLEKLAGSVQALLDVGEEPQEEPQTTGVETIIEAPAQKRRMMPVWSMILLALTAVIILGGVGWWLVAQISPKPTDEITSSMVATPTDTSNLETTPTLINIIANTSTPGPSSSTGWTDWRPVSFVIPNPQIWEESGDNQYTAIEQHDADAFAWSTKSFDGDLMVSLDLQSPVSQNSGCVIIFGDGNEHSYGSL